MKGERFGENWIGFSGMAEVEGGGGGNDRACKIIRGAADRVDSLSLITQGGNIQHWRALL